MGASLSAYVGKHTMGLTLEFLSKQWPSIKPLLTDLLLRPSFPEREIETEKNLLLQDIQSERDMPAQVCQLNFQKLIYGEHHYGRSGLGTEGTVKTLGQTQLRAFYQSYIHQGGVVVSSVGNFEKNRWEMELSEILQQLPVTGTPLKKTDTPKPQQSLQVAIDVKQPLQQSHLLIGFLGPNLKSKDRFALKLLHSCLSGQGGRLFLELRDKLSLAYSVAPLQVDNLEGGLFGVYMGCSPEKLATATHAIRAELEKVITQNITPKELARAKQYLLGRIALDMQRFSSQAMVYGLDEMYGLGFDFSSRLEEQIRSISAETIRMVAEKYLVLDKAVISVVHNQQMEPAFIRHSWEKGHPSLSTPQVKKKGSARTE
jgi:zinc protease